MSRYLTVVSILLLLVGCGEQASQSQPAPAEKPAQQEITEQQVLEELLERIKSLLEKACPEARFAVYDDWIMVGFKDEVQCEHAPYPGRGEMDWYFMAPKADGFRLEVKFMSKDGIEEPIPPHYLETPERTGFIKRFPLEWKKPYILIMTLRWGRDFDPAITEKIEPAIAAYAKERK